MNEVSLSVEQRRGRLAFRIFPSLPLGLRLALFVLVASAGISLMFRINLWLGMPVFIFGLMLGAARGLSNRRSSPDTTNDRWVMGAGKDMRKIRRKMDQAKGLPANPLSAVSGWGCLTFLLFVVTMVAVDVFVVPEAVLERYLGPIVVSQAGVLLFVFFSAGAAPWAPPDLDKKIDLFEKVRDHVLARWQEMHPVVAPMLKIDDGEKEGKPTPEDMKLFMHFEGAPEDFLGVQVQITFNRQMPYLYCVVLARDTFSPLDAYKPRGIEGITFKKDADKDVRFLVVRKKTSKTEYSTDEADALRVVDVAMGVTRELLGKA